MRRLRAVNARLETPPWLSSGRDLPERAAALWREAARCERLRAVTHTLNDACLSAGRAAMLASVLQAASSMPACIVFLQAFSYHFNHSAGSATPCAVLVSWPSAAAGAQPLGRASLWSTPFRKARAARNLS